MSAPDNVWPRAPWDTLCPYFPHLAFIPRGRGWQALGLCAPKPLLSPACQPSTSLSLLLGGSSSTHGHCAPPTRGRGLGQVCQQDPSSAQEGAWPQRGGLVLCVRRPTGPQIKGTHCLPCTEERSLWSPHKRLITRLLSTTLRWLISLDG